jgi:hypothetical protein
MQHGARCLRSDAAGTKRVERHSFAAQKEILNCSQFQMRDTATAAYYRQFVQTNQGLTAQGATSIAPRPLTKEEREFAARDPGPIKSVYAPASERVSKPPPTGDENLNNQNTMPALDDRSKTSNVEAMLSSGLSVLRCFLHRRIDNRV